ncbi:hypothetical protein ACSNOI_17645 [Actinomadura kijaniata]|uniref:hypothetical protein n=1 Tax=Actinomadura kijaniata TaxID=46161 RepID=UPI003F1B1662
MTGYRLPWLRQRSGTPISATGFDTSAAIFQGVKRAELQHGQVRLVLVNKEPMRPDLRIQSWPPSGLGAASFHDGFYSGSPGASAP